MTAADYTAVDVLMRQLDAEHVSHAPEVFRAAPDDPLGEESYTKWLARDGQLLGAFCGATLVAFVAIVVQHRSAAATVHPEKRLLVDPIVVAEDWKGRGVGLALMNAARAYAVEHGCAAMELDVWDGNVHAKRFYERYGFKPLRSRMRLPLV